MSEFLTIVSEGDLLSETDLTLARIAVIIHIRCSIGSGKNISMRTLLVQQDWVRTGRLSAAPEASDVETKAARLSRYAELRWSPDVSSVL
jgi:hypothetical protein